MPTPQDQSILAMIRATPVIFPILTFAGGLWAASLSYTRSVATMPYVDQKFDDSIKFTKDVAEATIKSCHDYSDMNRKDLTARIEAFGSKLDMIFESQKVLQQQFFDSRRR